MSTALESELRTILGSALEARWLAEDVTDTSVARGLAERRRRGEPLQYLLGHWSFRHLDLMVDRRVLIPRPETEQVVKVALGALEDPPRAGPAGPAVVDLGTGSGAIALAIATETARTHPDLRVWATDLSPDALDVARANRDRVDREVPGTRRRVELCSGSWWGALPAGLRARVGLAVANPPYVAGAEWPTLQREVREHEPRRALVSADGPDGTPGMADVTAVLAGAPPWLAPGGTVVVELAPHQSDAAASVARETGLVDVRVARDLAGRERMIVARRPE